MRNSSGSPTNAALRPASRAVPTWSRIRPTHDPAGPAGMSAGDEVRLRWDTGVLRTSLVDTRLVAPSAVGVSTVFHLTWPAPGTIRVGYAVGRADGRWSVSEHVTVTVAE
ncbi:hypothetical protein [Streptomyces abikoensis]|uniref:hypothetical protein n=1 Tax=Streptomyces abikoensis TaxID=97398 RepID=UPI0033F221E5